MRRYIAIRVAAMVPTLLGVSILVFLMVRFIPGDVVQVIIMEDDVSEEASQRMRARFGLDRPIVVQYAVWLGRAMTGDLGTAWRRGVPVSGLIMDRLSVSAELTLFAWLISVAMGIALGLVAALNPDTWLDQLARALAMLSLSVPVFWSATMLILVLSLYFHWIPPVDYASPAENLRANLTIMVLPAITLGTAFSGGVMRMTRSSMLDVLRQDYITTARSKGLARRVVLIRHALRNALIPIVTISGLQVGYLISGVVVLEEVFTLPGLGRLMVTAIGQRDYPIVQGVVLFVATAFVLSNFLTDLAYGWLDPRIKYGK